MKYLFLIAFFITVFGAAQDLNSIRLQYPDAVKSSELTDKMVNELSNLTSEKHTTLLAYKGALLTLKAKFSKSKNEKKEFFKEGVVLIENEIKADASNIEIRYLRISVQENSPRFLGYHQNIKEDKEFILENYSRISSRVLKDVIFEYVLESKSFEANEKSKLQKP